MRRLVDRNKRPIFFVMCRVAVIVAGMLCSQELPAQVLYQLGPVGLYAGSSKLPSKSPLPLIMQDAISFATTGKRIVAIEPRVIGGSPAPVGVYTWMASVQAKGFIKGDGHFCGGAFIAPQWVITAAHCVDKEIADKIQVVGMTNTLDDGGTIYGVDRIIVHEKWNADLNDFDVSLLHITKVFPAKTVRLVTPAEAPKLAAPGVLAIVSGWGLTSEGGQVSNILRHVTLQIVSNTTCNGLGSYSGGITAQMICAGFAEGGKDSCQGDSGGPLVVPDLTGGYALAGIVSFGEGCGRPNKFGVYTNVSTIQQWVADKIGRSIAPTVSGKPSGLSANARK